MKFTVVVAAAALISCCYGAPGEGKKQHGPMKCDGNEVKFPEDTMKAKAACAAKYLEKADAASKTKDNKGPMHANMTCLHVCELQAFGLISTDGKVVKANIATFAKNFPSNVQNALTTAWTACADEFGANLAISTDGKCDNYQPLVKCAMTSLHKTCKLEKPAST